MKAKKKRATKKMIADALSWVEGPISSIGRSTIASIEVEGPNSLAIVPVVEQLVVNNKSHATPTKITNAAGVKKRTNATGQQKATEKNNAAAKRKKQASEPSTPAKKRAKGKATPDSPAMSTRSRKKLS